MTPPADHAVRILVVDDQDVVCAALGALLATQPDFSVVGLRRQTARPRCGCATSYAPTSC